MPGTIRLFVGMILLVLAGSVDDMLPDTEFFLWTLALVIPGALLGLSGSRAMRRAGVA